MLEITFQNPIAISRVVILSGLDPQNNTYITNGQVMISTLGPGTSTPRPIPISRDSDSRGICKDYYYYKIPGNFTHSGEFDQSLSPVLQDIKCLRVIIVIPEKQGIIIREIQVFQ